MQHKKLKNHGIRSNYDGQQAVPRDGGGRPHGETTKIGTPTVVGATVTAKVLDAEARGPKGVAFKFKRRKGFHKKIGFRAALTKVQVTAINA